MHFAALAPLRFTGDAIVAARPARMPYASRTLCATVAALT